MTSQIQPLLAASTRMMLRSRGVVLVMVAIPTYLLVFTLMDVDWSLRGERTDLFDFILPGLAAFTTAHLLLDTVTAVGATYKARGVLKRLAVTPVSAPRLIAVQMLTYTILGVVSGTAVLTAGWLLGAEVAVTAQVAWVVPLIALVMFTMMGLAFTIAGILPNPGAANQTSNGLSMVLMFFSGAMFPLDALPGALPDITKVAVPLAAPIRAIRGIVLDGNPVTDYGPEILIGAAWAGAMLTLATLVYRFDQE